MGRAIRQRQTSLCSPRYTYLEYTSSLYAQTSSYIIFPSPRHFFEVAIDMPWITRKEAQNVNRILKVIAPHSPSTLPRGLTLMQEKSLYLIYFDDNFSKGRYSIQKWSSFSVVIYYKRKNYSHTM